MKHLPCGAKETVCVSDGVSQTAIIIVRADGSAAQEVITILIENYIPFGYANRISREKLSADTHMSDRKNRKLMEEALLYRDTLIINIFIKQEIPENESFTTHSQGFL